MSHEVIFDDQKLVSVLERIIELFYEYGIRNLNMDDISHHLKISKKTLYKYFKSKEDLLEKIFLFDCFRWNKKIYEVAPEKHNAIDVVIYMSIRVYEEMSRLNPKLKFEMKKYYEPLFNQHMTKKQDMIFHEMSKNIIKGKSEGLYREDVDAELTARLYVRNLIDMQNKEFFLGAQIDFNQVFEVLFENYIRSISTPDGIAYFEERKSELTHLQKK